ncbi:orotidine 5'-phosphate decarboxylase [Paenibacillus sp. P25]|nr:orotidine 5'-phosphate decarboxylase [Paenibacillus sp. P25]
MKLQLALDRMTIPAAIAMVREVGPYIDWIEVGTSLIKEFGMESVEKMKNAYPDKIVVADVKTFDNAKYEFELCYRAGADVATVMGAAPPVTVETCMETAARYGREVMIDLLHTTEALQRELFKHRDAILCLHVSKDEQEAAGLRLHGGGFADDSAAGHNGAGRIAIAGGITLKSSPGLMRLSPSVMIVGSAITGAAQPERAASELRDAIGRFKEEAGVHE